MGLIPPDLWLFEGLLSISPDFELLVEPVFQRDFLKEPLAPHSIQFERGNIPPLLPALPCDHGASRQAWSSASNCPSQCP